MNLTKKSPNTTTLPYLGTSAIKSVKELGNIFRGIQVW